VPAISRCFSTKTDDYIVQWFDKTILDALEKDNKTILDSSVDYWIGITSESIGENYFFRTRRGTFKDRILSVLTSEYWERDYSPPSVFEYIVISTFICTLECLSLDFRKELTHPAMNHYETRGCLFDFTSDKQYRRILVSSPHLCSVCTEKLRQLETIIRKRSYVSLSGGVNKILSRKWMGKIATIESPIYNLKKNYGYDVNRNSGFYKKPWEIFRDSVIEHSAEWTIGGIISTALTVFGAYLALVYHLQLP
jgi:hypothetical protein